MGIYFSKSRPIESQSRSSSSSLFHGTFIQKKTLYGSERRERQIIFLIPSELCHESHMIFEIVFKIMSRFVVKLMKYRTVKIRI